MTQRDEARGARTRVLTLSTVSFTLMFAVWLMFGILGKPIQQEFGLSKATMGGLTSVALIASAIGGIALALLAGRALSAAYADYRWYEAMSALPLWRAPA